MSTSLREELYSTSRAVLVGVGEYEHPAFPVILEAQRSLRSLCWQLCWQWPMSRVTLVADPRTPAQLEERLRQAARDTTGVLLIYYLGYAVVGADRRLWLTTASSRPELPQATALPWDAVTAIFGDTCAARARAVLLDLRLVGPGAQALLDRGAGPALAQLARIEDGCTLVAVTRPRARPEVDLGTQWSRHHGSARRRTDLVSQLYRTARAADPAGPPWLTLAELAGPLHDAMLAQDLPIPGVGGLAAAGRFPFTTRPETSLATAQTAARPEPENRIDPRLLDPVRKAAEGERVARTIGSTMHRAIALAGVAAAVADFDARRSAMLFAEAEACMFFGSSAPSRWALSGVANAMVDCDPVHAGRIVRSAAPFFTYAYVYIGCAFIAALDVRHPGHAERFALAEPDVYLRGELFLALAERRAAEDPHAAERIAAAQPLSDGIQFRRLALVRRLVDADVTTAQRVARTINNPELRAEALAEVARAIIATEPRWAVRLVRKAGRTTRPRHPRDSPTSLVRVLALATRVHLTWAAQVARSLPRAADRDQDQAFLAMAVKLATVDQLLAQRMTRLIKDAYWRDKALTKVVEGLAASDPDHALLLAQSLLSHHNTGGVWRAVVTAIAGTDAAKAERILRSPKLLALYHDTAAAGVAKALACRDPWRAERVAHSIKSSNPEWKDETLAAVAAGWAQLARAAPTRTSAVLDAAAAQDATPEQTARQDRP